MHIVIDARFINPRNRGLSYYTKNLIDNLVKIDQQNQYSILLRQEDYATLNFPTPNFQKILAEAHWYGWKEQILIPYLLHKLKPDLVHFPHFNVPILYRGSFVVTIHDLILFSFPTKKATTLGPIFYQIKNWAYRFTIKRALKKSRFIISVSRSTAQAIQKFFPTIEKEKIQIIYEGAGGQKVNQLNIEQKNSQKNRQKWLSEKGIKNFPFIFYLGGAYPHKNLERLIMAFDLIQKKYPFKTKLGVSAKETSILSSKSLYLVIAGGNDYFFNRLKLMVKKKKIPKIIFPGFIKDSKTLEFLYQEALFCIFPSLCEGFGLPPLEAFERNKLVLCHEGTCFSEILGNSALYFNGYSIENMAKTILETLRKLPSLEKKYLPRAQKILKKYNWEKTAQETLKLYLQKK